VPYYRELSEEGRRRFEDDVRIFIAEQTITGAGDHEVDDTTRVLIGASAAMLSHGLPEWEWPEVRDVVVYPQAFDERYDIAEEGKVAGQVHLYGPVIFSARDLRLGFRHRDGHNVGIHELAHVIDMEDGSADGVPVDAPVTATAPWIDVVARRLRKIRRGGSSPLRDYAGTNEAEVFAVAVETFFEQPRQLAKRDRELFDLLCVYFNQDPRHPGKPLTIPKADVGVQ
jgi:Mlc titration factor MtfA (ptsG expression regulator)